MDNEGAGDVVGERKDGSKMSPARKCMGYDSGVVLKSLWPRVEYATPE